MIRSIIEFLIRIGGFAVGLYFILEYIVICDVSTKVGALAIFATAIVTTFLFMKYRAGNVTICKTCNRAK